MEIAVNQRVEMLIGHRYHALRVEDVEDGCLWLSAPLEAGWVVPLALNTTVRGRLIDDRGVLEFAGRVVDRRDGTVPLIGVRVEGSPVRTERRQTGRIVCHLRVQVVLQGAEGGRAYDAWLLDFSRVGARVQLVNAWPEPRAGQPVAVVTRHDPPTRITGEIVWVQPSRSRGGPRYLVGIRWTRGTVNAVASLSAILAAQSGEAV